MLGLFLSNKNNVALLVVKRGDSTKPYLQS